MSRPFVALLLTLALAGCSDDGDNPGIEAGAPDGPVVDRGPGGDIAVPDAALPDQGANTMAPDTTSTSTSTSGWTQVMAAPNLLNAVWAKIFHYDGTSWTKTPPPKTSFLNAVHGNGTKDVWAVGKSNILHFTGKP